MLDFDYSCSACGERWDGHGSNQRHTLDCPVITNPKKYGVKLSSYGFDYDRVSKRRKESSGWIDKGLTPKALKMIRVRVALRDLNSLIPSKDLKARIKEIEQWLDRHGYVGPTVSAAREAMRRRQEAKNFARDRAEDGLKVEMPTARFEVDGMRVFAVSGGKPDWTTHQKPLWYAEDERGWVEHSYTLNPNELKSYPNKQSEYVYKYTNPDEIDTILPWRVK